MKLRCIFLRHGNATADSVTLTKKGYMHHKDLFDVFASVSGASPLLSCPVASACKDKRISGSISAFIDVVF